MSNKYYLLTYHHFSSLNVLEMSPVLTRSRVLAAKTMLDALPSPICSHARRDASTIAKPATLPVFYKYTVDSDFPWSSTTSLTMCTLYATITGLRAASTQKPCDIHFTRVFTCSVYTSSDSSCLLFATRVPSWTRFVDKSHRLVITTDRFHSNCRGKE